MKKLLQFILSKAFLKQLILLAVIGVVIIFGLYLYLHFYTGHGETVEVPQVEGMTVDEAALIFGEAELEFFVIDSVYSREGLGGTIVDQSPLAGKRDASRTRDVPETSARAPTYQIPWHLHLQ